MKRWPTGLVDKFKGRPPFTMSLRSDSVYRVDLHSQQGSELNRHSGSPPKVLQIRLTEQALQQLTNAYSNADVGNASIRIDVDPTDPLLIIGDSEFPLHAPLPASGSRSSNTTNTETGVTSTAPHELYKLSEDESTLHRVDTITTKFSVKPTRDVSAVAQRLKQQKEEEEHRKEERRRALMQGASPHTSASSSSRSGVNKALAGVRASSGSPSVIASPLSRPSSLNRLSGRREPNLLHSPALSRDVSRERSEAASPAPAHLKPTGPSYDATTKARRADRAITDSPQRTSLNRTNYKSAELEEDGQLPSDGDQPEKKSQQSSPAIAGSEAASRKPSKLTTRQRLAKATKAGSRLLAASERRATPERWTAPSATQASPPSKLATPAKVSTSESSGSNPLAASLQRSPSKTNPEETSPSASSRRAAPASSSYRANEEAGSRSTCQERNRRPSAASTAATNLAREKPLTAAEKSSGALLSRRADEPTRSGSSSTPKTRSTKDSMGSNKTSEPTAAAGDRRSQTSESKTKADSNERKVSTKQAAQAAVQVVTMKKAKPSSACEARSSKAAASSRPSKRSEPESCEQERSAKAAASKREQPPADKRVSTSTTSSSSTKANGSQTQIDRADPLPRKRRRTDDFSSSDSFPRHREIQPSTSSSTSNPCAQENARRREASPDESLRRVEPTSPRASIPVSASMLSFTSASNQLPTVAEDRETERRKTEYHDRRRNWSCDESRYEAQGSQERDGRSRRDDAQEHERSTCRGRDEGGRESSDVQGQPCGLPLASPSANIRTASTERPIKGVGPGATHWSEPWLDVRSKADWHRLAQRFTKTQDEYIVSRQRLEIESRRLERELELATEEEELRLDTDAGAQVPAEQGLLFSAHRCVTTGEQEVEMETAINTSLNARRRRTRAVDADESPEEGEMRSSDDEAGKTGEAGGDAVARRSAEASDAIVLASSRRSESPEGLAWRFSSQAKSSSMAVDGSDAVDRPLSYTDLTERVKQLGELHGSLSRMHRVLVEFKGKENIAATAQ